MRTRRLDWFHSFGVTTKHCHAAIVQYSNLNRVIAMYIFFCILGKRTMEFYIQQTLQTWCLTFYRTRAEAGDRGTASNPNKML